MSRPELTEHNAATGETITREMTEEEYQELLATGWTLDAPSPNPAGDPS